MERFIESTSTPSVIAIILLNWNNGGDTIQCLESLMGLRCEHHRRVIVCDNQSTDDSVDQIFEWGKLRKQVITELTYHDAAFDAERFEQVAVHANGTVGGIASSFSEIVLIRTGANRGFAGGNNVGLRYALTFGQCDFAFILNNDTVVCEGAIEAMVARLRREEACGICGCRVIYYHAPERIQALGGSSFQKWLGRGRHIGAHAPADIKSNAQAVEQRMDYVLGAAMMVTRHFLQTVGLMDESYFLYYEELDWAIRARQAGFTLGYADSARIFHKEGASIGSSHVRSKRSLLSEYYMARNRLLLTRRFYPWWLPTVVIFTLLLAARAGFQRDIPRALALLRGMMGMPRPA